jgi:phospholipid-binding lipoprotein MlaA
MRFKVFIFTIILLALQGCTNKSNTLQIKPQAHTTQNKLTHIKQTKNMDTEENFEDEFATQDSVEKNDPLSGYNKIMTSFNDKVFTYALDPISRGYAYVLPQSVRESLSNAIHNIEFPIRFANNLLQGKFKNSADELGRFVFNSTIGLGGLFDPASSQLNIPAHNEDFGQTLGYYGIGSGFHVVLPFLGPSNVRDIVGLTADAYTSPLVYQKGLKRYKVPNNYGQGIAIYAGKIINKNSLHLGAYESLKKDAIDLYPFLRDIYEEKRISDIAE